MKSKVLAFGSRTFIMGIINLTPDSFSGDGLLTENANYAAAMEQAHRFIADGADILDIGGESTRPGAEAVSADEEKARVIPFIHELNLLDLDVILSIDTYKAEVAEEALKVGAHWVNDVWALRADPRLAETTARYQATLILMHNRSKPGSAELQSRLGGRYVGVEYDDLLADVSRELLSSVHAAQAAGIPAENLILDPGIGFGKTVEQNLILLNRLNEIKALGYPILLGPSRKSFIGYTLNLPPDERLEGTLAACAVGIQRGVDIIRVHDVQPAVRLARMTDAILNSN